MKRHAFLASAAAVSAAPLVMGSTAMASGPSFVLVHGAFVDATCWHKVIPRLRTAGASVAAPNLPGAERDDPAAAGKTTMDDYVRAVSATVDAAPQPVVLVGHSMAGMIVSQVAEERPHALAAVVYLSAYYPLDGDTLLGFAQTDSDSALGKTLAVDQQHGIATLSDDAMRDAFFNGCSQADTEDGIAHKRTQPLQPFVAPVKLTAANFETVPRHYISTSQDRAVSPALQARMLARRPVRSRWTIAAGHASFFSHDGELASTLLQIAGS